MKEVISCFLLFVGMVGVPFLTLVGCSTYEVAIEGYVLMEMDAAERPEGDHASSDFFYTLGEAGIIVRSGSAQAITDTNGKFSLEGSTLDGDVLLEVMKSDYKTAYLYVEIDGLEEAAESDDEVIIRQNVLPTKFIAYGASGNVRFVPDEKADNFFDQTLDEQAEAGEIIVLLIREPGDGQEVEFMYKSP